MMLVKSGWKCEHRSRDNACVLLSTSSLIILRPQCMVAGNLYNNSTLKCYFFYLKLISAAHIWLLLSCSSTKASYISHFQNSRFLRAAAVIWNVKCNGCCSRTQHVLLLLTLSRVKTSTTTKKSYIQNGGTREIKTLKMNEKDRLE